MSQQLEMRGIMELQDETESLLLSYVTHEPIHIDDIQRQTRLPITAVSSTLAMMELRGIIKQVGSMHYIRVREAVAGYGS